MTMFNIDCEKPSADFVRCWQAAGRHLQTRAGDGLPWLKATLTPPFLEHLSFRVGNQLFFVRLEDVAGILEVPGSRSGLLMIAGGCRGHACIMPMRCSGRVWSAAVPGWGLIDAETGRPLDPAHLVTAEHIEMTDWELQDFAVQVVKDHLAGLGRNLMSWQGNPAVNPSIWFVGDDGPEWVVVRAARYPMRSADPPANLDEIAAACAFLGRRGHFASVSAANANDAFDPDARPDEVLPLWRGHGLFVSFHGLTPVWRRPLQMSED
jgi:hypothetical protein